MLADWGLAPSRGQGPQGMPQAQELGLWVQAFACGVVELGGTSLHREGCVPAQRLTLSLQACTFSLPSPAHPPPPPLAAPSSLCEFFCFLVLVPHVVRPFGVRLSLTYFTQREALKVHPLWSTPMESTDEPVNKWVISAYVVLGLGVEAFMFLK